MEEEQKDWLIGQLCFSICCPYYLGEEPSAIGPWVWQDLDVRQAFEKDHREMLKERLIETLQAPFWSRCALSWGGTDPRSKAQTCRSKAVYG